MPNGENQHRGRYNSYSVSVIAEDAVYRGDIEFEGVLHVNGDFYGNIKGNGDLGIGLTGRVRSVIHAGDVIISGLVWGNIFALGRVAVKSSAIVIGDIQASTLVVEEGSILHGKLEIQTQKERQKITKPGLLSYRKTNQGSPVVVQALQKQALQEEPSKEASEEERSNAAAKKQGLDRGKYSIWN